MFAIPVPAPLAIEHVADTNMLVLAPVRAHTRVVGWPHPPYQDELNSAGRRFWFFFFDNRGLPKRFDSITRCRWPKRSVTPIVCRVKRPNDIGPVRMNIRRNGTFTFTPMP